MNPDELLMQIYNDMLDVMASGRPTGSTERLANELRAYLGQPEWPTLETTSVLKIEPLSAYERPCPFTTDEKHKHYDGKRECYYCGAEPPAVNTSVCPHGIDSTHGAICGTCLRNGGPL